MDRCSKGHFDVAMVFTNRTGTESTNTLHGFFPPQFDLFNSAGFQILTGETFESYAYADSGKHLFATDVTHSTVAPRRVDTGSYIIAWSAVSSNRFESLGQTSLVSGSTASFTVIDDDTNAPIVTSIVVNSGTQITDANIRNGIWPLNMTLVDISGVYTGTGPDGPTWSPNYSMINSLGSTVAVEIGWDSITTADGTNFVALDSATPSVLYSNVSLGTYRMTWSAQDGDGDRDFDRLNSIHSEIVTGDSNTFNVIDDDTTAPLSPTNLILTPTTWTNANFFAVTWAPAVDAESGISEYRGSTNTLAPTLLTDGFTLPGITTTSPTPYTITNADFELGTDGLLVPGVVTNGWISYGSGGARARWTSAEKQNGALGIIHSVDAGASGLRDTLVSQDVDIFNSNDQQVVVSFSGYFKGDMSVAGSGGPPSAFLKVEFLDSNGVRIAMATVDNQYNTDHNGAPLSGVNVGAWTNITITTSPTNPAPANTETVRFLTGVAQNGRDVNLVGYWDNLSATVSLISFGGSSGITLTNAVEGVRTNWVFAVDDDNDRPNDRMMSSVTNFVTRYDATAPLQVVITNSGPGPDPTTDAFIGWDPLADGGGSDLSPWWTYVVYYTDEVRDPTNTDPYVSVDTGETALGTNTTTGVLLSNLTFGTTYRFTVAARDRAGNESTLALPATISLSAFSVTQGVVAAISGAPIGANLAWRASTNTSGAVNKTYDLIYADALNYSDSLTNQWNLLQTVTDSFVVDTGSSTRTPPTALINTMRFYRAALSGKWALTNLPTPLASREIYGAKNVALSNGQNFISMFVIPDSNTVAQVLGTNLLPAGPVMGSSTIISWYDPVSTNAAATNVIWLADSGHWIWEQGGIGSADDKPLPIDQGFNIEIPTNSPGGAQLLLIGRVPTNALSCPIYPSAAHNIVSYAAPRFCLLSELDIENSGFTGGTSRRQSDEVRVLAKGAGAFGSPRLRCWYDTGTGVWRRWSDGGNAMNEVIEPDEAIIIFTRKSNALFVWTNPLYYSTPGIHMNP